MTTIADFPLGTPSYEVLEAERLANLERIAAAHAATRTEESTMRHTVNLSHLSDAELGRIVRSALLTLVVDDLPAQLVDVLAERERVAMQRQTLLDQDRAERKANPGDYLLPAFMAGHVEVPPLDLTEVILTELAPAIARDPYNRAIHALGAGEPLDPATATWETLRTTHRALTVVVGAVAKSKRAPKAAVAAEIKPDVAARRRRIDALAEVLSISKRAAAKRLAELDA